jgi:hypothetical protein
MSKQVLNRKIKELNTIIDAKEHARKLQIKDSDDLRLELKIVYSKLDKSQNDLKIAIQEIQRLQAFIKSPIVTIKS